MANSAASNPLTRVLNTTVAVAAAAFILTTYWPLLQLFDLARADLHYQGVWIGENAKRVTTVTPGGAAERAGLRAGDVLQFNPANEADWVLAGYRQMPEGFTAMLPVRHADGTASVATFLPERVTYLPTLNDRLALVAYLVGLTVSIILAVLVVWAHPGLMAWSLLLSVFTASPGVIWVIYFFAFDAGRGINVSQVVLFFSGMTFAWLSYALCFPRNTVATWSRTTRSIALLLILAWLAYWVVSTRLVAFQNDNIMPIVFRLWIPTIVLSILGALVVFWRTYRRSDGNDRARLKWAMLGMSAVFLMSLATVLALMAPRWEASLLSGNVLTPGNWITGVCFAFFWPLALGYAILHQRVVDVQFAVSRTLVYGTVSTLAVAIVAAAHWILGRLIEHSGLTIGLEGLVAIGLGLVLHRLSHAINGLIDRLLFRQHHQAEQRLHRVIAALPYATDERSIAEALVHEPARHLNLASAALFYRDAPDGPLRRVLAYGWNEQHAMALDADAMLVRYLQAEHKPLSLDDPQWLPGGHPEGVAVPVLAIPLVNQHALTAVVLYSGHSNSTLPDPDEVELLHALAKVAATSHQQVRIAMLTREIEAQKARNDRLEGATAELRALVNGFSGRVQP